MEVKECALVTPARQNSGSVVRQLARALNDNDTDPSDGEQVLVSPGSSRKLNRKRKRANLTDVSCSSLSSGTCSPQNIPWCLGFIGRTGFESNEEKSDCSNHSKPFCGVKGYDTATTAVITDSEDDFFFPNEAEEFHRFEVEYEPPESNSEDEKDDDDDDEDEPQIIISSDDEDPGADGGDEYDEDDIDTESEVEDSWECDKCKTMNHPMTRRCVVCWENREDEVCSTLVRTTSVPAYRLPEAFTFPAPATPTLHRSTTIGQPVHIYNSSTANKDSVTTPSASRSLLLTGSQAGEASSRSSSSCSNTQHSCDSGICISSCETDNESTLQNPTRNKSALQNLQDNKSALQNLTDNEPALQNPLGNESALQNLLGTESALQNPLGSEPPMENPSANQSALQNSTGNMPDKPKLQKPLPAVATCAPETVKNSEEMCVICQSRPRDASIIHGRSGHQVCCMHCAEKLKAYKKKCPVCRRKIHFVVKNFL
ncbi:protein Mdm4 [Nematostella vectensis]|uniref:protein Mdm4 n=1 Tax=Nematostella vectensis TaxID=45351 RepID=UPI0020774C51|nr:protein Mdm4 [Nematostella vectensis]